jgi:hypothetical protein
MLMLPDFRLRLRGPLRAVELLIRRSGKSHLQQNCMHRMDNHQLSEKALCWQVGPNQIGKQYGTSSDVPHRELFSSCRPSKDFSAS